MNRKMIKFIIGAAIVFLIIKSCSVGKPQLPPGIEIASDFGSRTDALGRTRSQTHQGIDIKGLNPHHFWADGPGKVTCFIPGRNYPENKITWPVRCNP